MAKAKKEIKKSDPKKETKEQDVNFEIEAVKLLKKVNLLLGKIEGKLSMIKKLELFISKLEK